MKRAQATSGPALRRPARPLDLVVHAGTGKTGTSSLQQLMNLNRERIAEAGHLYPRTPGAARHARLTLFVKPDEELDEDPAWHRQKTDDPATFRRRFRRRLLAEIEKSGLSRVIFSEETIFMSSDATHRRLRRFVDNHARSLRLVVYLRRQDDHLVSRYQQGVKVGEVRRLADPSLHQDYSRTYDYAARLTGLKQVLEPSALVVRRYEREGFRNGSLFEDFLEAIGVDVPIEELVIPVDANVSLDAESVEFLRLLNMVRVQEGQRVGLVDNRRLIRQLATASGGPTLMLPEASLDAFMSQWEPGNREVARTFLGQDDGVLFRTPRKTAGTTPVQLLDPARLGHFFEVVDLPEPLHGPVRALAEGEARRHDAT